MSVAEPPPPTEDDESRPDHPPKSFRPAGQGGELQPPLAQPWNNPPIPPPPVQPWNNPPIPPPPVQPWNNPPIPPPPARLNEPSPPPQPALIPTQTQYSPDGRYLWDGHNWSPVPWQSAPAKNKVAAGLLAIFLGDFGAHKFYLGQTGVGILYLVFFWTFIPALVGLAEGIVFLTMSDYDFNVRYGTAEQARQRPMF